MRPKSETTLELEKIAAKSGYSIKYLRQLKNDGMPLDLSGALSWIANRPDSQPASSPTDEDSPARLRKERVRLLGLQSQKAELALQIEKGRFIEREQVATYLLQVGTSLAVFLARFEREIPQVCSGLDLPKALSAAKKKSDELRQLWANGESEFWQSHPTE